MSTILSKKCPWTRFIFFHLYFELRVPLANESSISMPCLIILAIYHPNYVPEKRKIKIWNNQRTQDQKHMKHFTEQRSMKQRKIGNSKEERHKKKVQLRYKHLVPFVLWQDPNSVSCLHKQIKMRTGPLRTDSHQTSWV